VATILVVDDARTDRELMARVINASGHRALIAVDGKEAVALAKQHRPALIFLDVVIPELTGYVSGVVIDLSRLLGDGELAAIASLGKHGREARLQA
jgi:CheY-like chemotaxis protein